MIVEGFHPAFVLIIGSLLLAVVPSHRLRQIILVTLPFSAYSTYWESMRELNSLTVSSWGSRPSRSMPKK